MADREQARFHDHFSERAPGYAIYRPSYPRELVDYLMDRVVGVWISANPKNKRIGGIAWEAGCGSGQLTHVLAERFERVFATDASADQIAQAKPHPRAEYRVARADASGLPDHAADLAIAAQAAHWFDLDAYYAEVRRVVRPGGFVALVVYGIHATDDPQIDSIIKHFYGTTLGEFWLPQRRLVEEGYRTMPFPFDEIPSPQFEMRAEWTLVEMLGYVETWSAVGALSRAKGRAQIDAFREEIAIAWGNPQTRRTVRWPLSMRLGRT